MKVFRHTSRTIPALALAVVASCASMGTAPKEARITDEVAVQASVVSVNKDTREVTLQGSEGPAVTIVAGPQIRNFDQIEAGDTVTARYMVDVIVRRLEEDEPDTEPTAGLAAAGAEMGERPAGVIGAGIAMTVVVKSIDRNQNLVTFTDPAGMLHAVEAERDEGQRFIKGLKPGDRVELTYGETLALSVE